MLIRAVKAGDVASAEVLLNDKMINVNSADKDGITPLLQSLLSRNKEIYMKLLKRGADPNVCDRLGRCVMNEAATENDTFWLKESLAHGGDPNALNKGNKHSPNSTPLFYAIQKERPGEKPRVDNVKVLIDAGANVNHRNANGVGPLRAAAGAGNYECVVELLEAGADPLVGDKHGYTLVNWFNGRDENLVPDEDQIPWFNRAAEMLIERGLLERDADGNLKKKPSD
ncbi:MAG TPA: ankyrin repeat domain-containing protein [Pirellulaceae bacterium]|nr:ankyrin repeat domain-containing protein [Pirellulaceae bacterium]